jgi:filamentous hemagglutinin family protein
MKRKMWWLKRSSSPHLCARYLMLFCALGVIFLPTSYVWANPAGEQVVGGAATFQRDGNKLTVNQATDRLAVNWQSFNIGAGETTHFNMPSSTSAALNRVIGGNPTSIYGSLSANGILYLINPSGILVGPGGTVNAASFMASTLDVSTEQFMNAKSGAGMSFVGTSGESIINQGNITAEKGDVFLIAQKVENRGTINAANGTAGMVGSGQNTDVMVHEVGGKGFAIRVAQLQGEAATGSNRDLPDGEELLNEGTISAAQAELNASGNVYALAIRNSGTIRAKAVVANADGTVRLDGGLGDVMNTGRMYAKNSGDDVTAAGGKIDIAGQNITASPESIITAAGGEQGGNGGSVKIDSQGTTIVQGKVNVAAPSASAKGGKVELMGERVGLLDGAKVDASGGAGGGTVLAGGDYLGGRTPSADLKNLAKQETEPVKNAKATVMADTAEIIADATVDGDGGKIIVWSDEYTGFFGELFARAGAEGGNGGFIETSSKENLQAYGLGNASASNGRAGLWLLDPRNVSIVTGGTGTLTAGVFTPSTDNATIAPTTITTALNGGTSVTINTGVTGDQAGNITVANAVNTTGNPASDLTLSAANNIIVNTGATINLGTSTSADLILTADSDFNGLGNITTSAALTLGGNATLTAAGPITLGALMSANNVFFRGSLAGSTMGINDASGTVQISSTSLTTNLAATGTVTVGRSDGTGLISIGSLGALNLSGEGYNLALLGTGSSVNFNFTGANTLTLKNGGTMTVNIGTGNLLSPGAATTDLTIGTTGSLVITSAGQVGTAAAPFTTSIANLSGITSGQINVSDTDATGLTVNSALSSGNNNITLASAAGGTFINTAAIDAGTGIVTLSADNMTLSTASLITITGNGGIVLQPTTTTRGVDLVDNTGGAGVLSLSLAEMQNLISSGSVQLGAAGTGGAINIGNQGDIDLSAQGYSLGLRGNSNVSFNFSAPNNLTIKNGRTFSVAIGAGQLLSPGDTSTDLAAVTAGSVNFSVTSAAGIGSASAPFTTQLGTGGAFSAAAVTGSTYLSNTGDFLVNAPVVTGNNNYSVSTTGTFSNTTAGTINAGTGTITITAGGLSIGGNMSAGNVNLVPITAGISIGLNDATKTFNVSATALQNLLVPASGVVTLGSSAGTATITIGTSGAIDLTGNSYDLTLQTLSGGAKFNNLLQMSGGKTLNFKMGIGNVTGKNGTDIDVVIGDLASGGGTLRFESAGTVNNLVSSFENLGTSVLSGNMTLVNKTALTATGPLTVGGSVTLTVGGSFNSSQILTVPGSFSVTLTDAGSDILLTGNNVLGSNVGATFTVSGLTNLRDFNLKNTVNKNPGGSDNFLGSLAGATSLDDLTLNFTAAAVTLDGTRLPIVNGNLSVTSFGNLSQSGAALRVLGTSSFTVSDAASNISLNSFANDLRGAVSLFTNPNSSLQNIDLWANNSIAPGLILGEVQAGTSPSTGGGNLRLRTGNALSATEANLSQTTGSGTGLLLGAGGLYLTLEGLAGSKFNVSLGNALNDFTGQVQFDGGQTLLQDFTYSNANASARIPLLSGSTGLRDLVLAFSQLSTLVVPNLSASDFPLLRNISFTTTALGSTIIQASGGVVNTGTATFNADSTITLTDSDNNFGGAVSLNTVNSDATIRESSGLILGTSNLGTGDLSVTTTAGTTTQTGIITASQFDINAGGSVTLGQSNLIDTVAASVTGAGNSFSFANAQDLEIGTAGLLSGITTSSGDIVVSTAASGTSGIITVNNTIFAGGAGNVLMSSQAGGDLLINANVGAAGVVQPDGSVLGGKITLLAENDLTTGGTGVLIGAINKGAIVMRADSAQSDAGTLTIAANDIVGSTLNSSDYIFSGADLNLAGIVRQSGVDAKITLAPTLATGYTELGNNTTPPPTPPPPSFSSYVLTADELFNIQSAGTVVVGGADYLGNISLGDLNLVGNVFKNFLLQSSPGGLTTVGTGASTGTYSIVSSGVNVEIDSRVQLDGNNLNISTTGGNNSLGADVVLQQEFLGGFFTALLNGGLIVNGGTGGDVTVNSSLGNSQQLGLASITGNDVTVNSIDTNGGVISLTTGTGSIMSKGNLNSTAREDFFAPAPPAAGSITIEATGAGRIFVKGSINARGAQGKTVTTVIGTTSLSIDQSGGTAGNVTLRSGELGEINVGGPILAYGGDAVVNSLSRGSDGTITIDGYNVGLTRDQIAYYGTKFDIKGRNNLIFASQPNYVTPTTSIGGASIIMNQLENGTAALNDPTLMTDLAITYGKTGAGQLYMGSGSSIQMFGGDISVDRITAPTTSLVGGMTLGEIYTTGRGISSGNVSIGSAFNAPVSVNYIDTSGGSSTATSTSSQSGISGGNVSISGTAVSLGEVDTRGSSPLSTAEVPAIGGTGGALIVNGTSVSILGNLSTSGGVGAGATGVRSTGGSGGEISIYAASGIVLDSVNLSTPTFVFDSSGSTGVNGGLSGSGGKINLTGPISAAANGVVSSATTAATSLDLRFSGRASSGVGSIVTLGTTSSDAITLGTLITAGGSGVTRGTFTVNGALQVDTLSTAAQPYSIELLGDGSVIQNRVTFLNSGTATIGRAGVTTTFTDGFDALSGATVPSTLKLGGTINTVTATTGSMLANATVLVADTILNSAGNIIQLGSLDGTYGLTLAAGVAGGNTTFTGAVGDTTEVGQITVANGVTGLVSFGSTVNAGGIQSTSTSKLVFNNDVTLSGTGGAITSLAGTLTLNNQAYLDGDLTARLSLLGAGSKTISATTTLSGGPIEFGGLGGYTVTGTINGAQNLILSGGISGISGTKTFTGTVGGTTALGTGTGAAISMSGGNVAFGKLTTASGIVSSANVALTDTTTLAAGDTASSLTGDVDLLGATLTSAGTVGLGDSAADSVKLDGAVRVNGTGAVTVKGAVTDNAGFTSFIQEGTAGKISFDENVTLDVLARSMTLNGDVGLNGMIFSTAGTVTLGDALTDSITLANAAVTLTGIGTFAVNGAVAGAQQLALQGTLTCTKTFASTVSVTGFTQDALSGTVTFQQNVTTTGVSTLGASTVLDGMTFTANGVGVLGATTMNGVTLSSGPVTLAGAGNYAVNGGVDGAQTLALAGIGAKTFGGIVGGVTSLKGINQAALSGTVTFQQNVTTTGVSTLGASTVLDGMTFTANGVGVLGATTMNGVTLSSGPVTLAGAGNYTANGAVGGGQNLILAGAGTKAFNSTLNLDAFTQTGGKVSLGGGVNTSGAVNLASAATTAAVVVDSTAATQTYGSVVLGGNLTAQTTSGNVNAVTFGGVTGSGDLTAKTAGLALNGVVANSGTFSAETSGLIDLGGTYLTATEAGRIQSSGGARFASSGGNVTATGVTMQTSLAMQALGGQTSIDGVNIKGALNMVSGGAVNFNGTDSSVSSLEFTGTKVSSDGIDGLLANIVVPSLAGITLTGSGNGLSYSTSGNLNVSGKISVNGGDITLDPSGNFVNSYAGNPFTANSTRILTKDLFSSWPSNGAVPGLQVVYGVNSIGQVSANQIGVSTTLLAGNAAPYILEFTTGTGQPYILAQQSAIPPVMLPGAITGGSGFARAASYSTDEIEMMTPEERSTYENQQRQISARVILQGESGEGEEIGAPTEGRTPQAASPAILVPVAPTAQVLLEGKPLAGAKTDQERGDATKIIKIRPTRAVALRSGLNVREVLESERMAAEVSVGAAPVAQSR